MEISAVVLLALALVSGIYAVLVYNNLVSLKHNVAKAWSNIDVLLKQRHDELPKLVDTCKQHMRFEQETLERVMRARAAVAAAREAGDVRALGPAEAQLRLGLGKLFALAEAYPALQSNENFRHLQTRISQLEQAIADRRELYNETVNLNNIRIEQFPDAVVAGLFRFRARPLLRFAGEETADVSVTALFR